MTEGPAMDIEQHSNGTDVMNELTDLASVTAARQQLDLLLLDALAAPGMSVPEMHRLAWFASEKFPDAASAWGRVIERTSGKDA